MIKRILLSKNKTLLAIPLVSIIALTGCQTNGSKSLGSFRDSLSGVYSSEKTDRMNTTAKDAIKNGHANEAILFYEKLYLQDSQNAEVALNYAQSLRKVNKHPRALMVLSPFLSAEHPEILMVLEYTSISLEMGQYEKAQATAQTILDDSKASDFHPQAHNLMGISQDAQGHYKSAEQHYRQAMENWTGPKAVNVMNNLALSLAHQGYFDDSLTTLRQARLLNPNKEELARNIEIISAIRNKTIRQAK